MVIKSWAFGQSEFTQNKVSEKFTFEQKELKKKQSSFPKGLKNFQLT